jgi:hypothetical protein
MPTLADNMNIAASAATVIAICLGAALARFGWVAIDADAEPLPQRLSDTGLFVDGSTIHVRPELLQFSPQYPLWSDGATKRRWIRLPPGTFIDATRPDAWTFPRGTQLWKEFSLGSRRVETRSIERLPDGSWRYATYVWNEEGSDALLAPPEGIPSHPLTSARNGRYAIPSEPDCRACHEGAAVPVLGFSALQLSSDRDPLAPHADPPAPDDVDLRALVDRGWLRNLPQTLVDNTPRIAAASPTERAALGYLHGNCGHCHSNPSDSGASVPVAMVLAQGVTDPARADRVLRSLIGVSSRLHLEGVDGAVKLVAPGKAHASVLPMRMRSRDPLLQMPPLGTAIPDSAGLALIERWIDHDLQQEKELRP